MSFGATGGTHLQGEAMRKLTIAAALAAIAVTVTLPATYAQTGGYGPGTMGGYDGYGMGPGMMGGYGMGPGMMGGYGGNGMGPGMMYGDRPMVPGMPGSGGYGPGPGMMGGYGGYRAGPGMMHGYGANAAGAPELTDDQREKLTKIHEALATRHWELMGKLQEQQFKLRELMTSQSADDAAVGKAYRNIESLRRQMGSARADAQKEIDALLAR
jgi:Spy/CpxP family protein refolding chaperone